MAGQTDYAELRNEVLKGMGALSKDIPEVMKGFSKLHGAGVGGGALSQAVKELISVGIAIAVRCEGCIACHVHDALAEGATPEQVKETIGVAVVMGGGPSVVYGAIANKALEQFLEKH